MTSDELKEALFARRPIAADIIGIGEVVYAYCSAVIYRRGENGQVKVSAELTDKNLRSVTIAEAERIYYPGEKVKK